MSKSYQILEDGSLLLDDGTIIELGEGLTTAIAEAHTVLDEEGMPRYSAADEMPPDTELSLAERIRRLARERAPKSRLDRE